MAPSLTKNFDITNFDVSDTANLFVTYGLKFLIVVIGAMYVFFALFLYLRIRILSLTLSTPNSGIMRYVALLHFFGVLGLAIFLGLLLLF